MHRVRHNHRDGWNRNGLNSSVIKYLASPMIMKTIGTQVNTLASGIVTDTSPCYYNAIIYST